MSKERITQLYNKYRKEGGFGVYSVDRLCARNVNIAEKIYQENTIMELYSAVYDQEISKSKLENYLCRKCMGIYERCSLQLKDGIPKECFVRGEDPFKTFSKRYRIHGYTSILYQKEKLKEMEKWNPKENVCKEENEEKEEEYFEFSIPTIVRSTPSTSLFSMGIYENKNEEKCILTRNISSTKLI
jgi:hypothetical protein